VVLLPLLGVGAAQAVVPLWMDRLQELGETQERILDLSAMEQVALLERIMTAYRNGDLGTGDSLRRNLRYPDGDALAEWYAIRRGFPMGYGRIRKFLDKYPTWPKSELFRQRVEKAYLEASASAAEQVLFFKSHPPQTLQGKLAFYRAMSVRGYKAEADEILRDIWRNEKLDTDTESFILSRRPAVVGKEDHRYRFERILFENDWRGAVAAGNHIGAGWDKIVDARRAVIEGEKGVQAAMAAIPEELLQEPANIFTVVRMLMNQKKYKDAAVALSHLPAEARLADGDRWWAERERLARSLLDHKEYKLAYDVASVAVAESMVERLDGAFLAGWIALRFLKKPDAAMEHFIQASRIGVSPISVTRAEYWCGRAAEAMNDKVAANRHYQEAARIPVAYYGQLARKKLNLPIGQVRALPYVLTEADLRRVAEMPAYKALKAAEATGNIALAILLGTDIAEAMDNMPDMDAFATLAFEDKNPRLGMIIGKQAYKKGLPLDYHSYPLGVIPEFEQKGQKIDTALVYAVSRQESSFDITARSSSGARGLMQLMPDTAKETAARLSLAYNVNMLTEDAAYNATLGTAYLAGLIRQWDGNLPLAFASYNAGAGNVKKWITAYGDPRRSEYDSIDWVERIPFPETRNYVQRVTENYFVYKYLMEHPQKMELPSASPAVALEGLSLRTGQIQ
jgi:soluble lytic murein transglycosylase